VLISNDLLQEWNGSYFTEVSLKQLGLRIQLGHPLGRRCANPAIAFNDDFVVIDTNAIHSVALSFCNCHLAQPQHIQLLRAQLFPATTDHPKTAATFRVLKNFQLLSFMSKVSAFEFYHTIARQTDNTGTKPPPVSRQTFGKSVLNLLLNLIFSVGSLFRIPQNGARVVPRRPSQAFGARPCCFWGSRNQGG